MTNTTPRPELFTSDELKALELIGDTVAADPFGLEAFRKLSFWFRSFVIATANDKPVLALGARKKFHLLYPELRDVTGTTDVLFEGMNRRTRAEREKIAEAARTLMTEKL